MEHTLYLYKATIVAVYDGDTVTAEVDLGFNVKFTEKFRLLDINTPEIRGDERPEGLISRDAVRDKILDKEVTILTKKDRKGKYGRYLATIFLKENGEMVNINEWIVSSGYGIVQIY